MTNAAVVALPTVMFLLTVNGTSLRTAALLAVGVAVIACLMKVAQRKSLIPAIAGLCLVTLCASVALWAGQKRAFFLLPALVLPAGIALTCVVSLLWRRPLAGLLLNGLVGGPEHWWQRRSLRALYATVTWVCLAVDVLSGFLQTIFYQRSLLTELATVHVLLPIVFSAIIAIAAGRARRQIAISDPADSASGQDEYSETH